MQRGANILFKDFFTDEAPVISINRRKGRSSELIEQRNDCLVHRYHYHRTRKLEGKTISYQSLVETVAAEFFLSKETVVDLMIDQHSTLTSLNKEYPADRHQHFTKVCSRKWLHLVW